MIGIKIFFLSLLCVVNIAWMWKEDPKIQQYMEKGYQAREAGNMTEAMNYYEQALALKPTNVEALNSLGAVYEELGLSQKAEEKYLNAIKRDSNFLPAYSNLGAFYWNQGNLEKAAYYLQKRVDLGNPKDVWTIKAKKDLEDIKAKNVVNRETEISQQLEQYGPQGSVVEGSEGKGRVNLINASLDQVNQTDTSKNALKTEIPSDSTQSLFAHGQELASQKKFKEAMDVYDQALKITPGVPEIVKARVDAYMQMKQQSNDWH